MKTKIYLLFYVLFLISATLVAQTNETKKSMRGNLGLNFECTPVEDNTCNHCLEAVTFSSTEPDDFVGIRYDIQQEQVFEAPHFVNVYAGECSESAGSNTVRFPVAYLSGARPKVEAVFLTDCIETHFIRGMASNGMQFPPQQVFPQNGKATYLCNTANIPFETGQVQYFPHFVIEWQMSENGSDGWLPIGESSNPLYVPKELDLNSNPSLGYLPPYHYTVLHTSCSAADGLSEDEEIIEAIYNKFKTKNVERITDGYVMTYWDVNAENDGFCRSTEDLLKYGNGQCGAWAEFFIVCLAIQGIEAIKVSINPSGQVTSTDIEMFIEANFPNQGYTPVSTLTYFLVKEWGQLENNAIIPLEGDDDQQVLFSPGLSGITAQGGFLGGYGDVFIPDPRSIFDNHSLTLINGEYYDPSYGADKSLFETWEDISIDAVLGVIFAITTDEQQNPIEPPTYYFWVKETNTSNTIQLNIN